ncbi:MAG TPA: hypothetical protein VJB66_04135 [Candidatus Nanoarchaeia archaeon]|nr:hypothetical protein [Candidatus Nanoarchaeia archaeon]
MHTNHRRNPLVYDLDEERAAFSKKQLDLRLIEEYGHNPLLVLDGYFEPHPEYTSVAVREYALCDNKTNIALDIIVGEDSGHLPQFFYSIPIITAACQEEAVLAADHSDSYRFLIWRRDLDCFHGLDIMSSNNTVVAVYTHQPFLRTNADKLTSNHDQDRLKKLLDEHKTMLLEACR